jgi:hypothetical protein
MFFGMKDHIGKGATSYLVLTLYGTSGKAVDLDDGSRLLHGEETHVSGAESSPLLIALIPMTTILAMLPCDRLISMY